MERTWRSKKICQICQVNTSRYKCPRCSLGTCSVKCVKVHKSGIDACDGVRNKSSFIPLSHFDKLDLLNDYHFLESASRRVESLARDELKGFTRKGENAVKYTQRMTQLLNAAKLRKIRLLYLPPHFERHQSNSSYIDYKKRHIYWKVEWHFPHSNNTVFYTPKFHENIRLRDFLTTFVTVFEDSQKKEEDDEFSYYRTLGFGSIALLLKPEGIQKNQKRFDCLDYNKTLKTNLKDKTIIENPIIWIVSKDHMSTFYRDTDEEDSDVEMTETVSPVTKHRSKKRGNTFGLFKNESSSEEEEDSKKSPSFSSLAAISKTKEKNDEFLSEEDYILRKEKEYEEHLLESTSLKLSETWKESLKVHSDSEYLHHYTSSENEDNIFTPIEELKNYKDLYHHYSEIISQTLKAQKGEKEKKTNIVSLVNYDDSDDDE